MNTPPVERKGQLWESEALFSRHQTTAVFGAAVVGSAKTRISNFHTICKRLI